MRRPLAKYHKDRSFWPSFGGGSVKAPPSWTYRNCVDPRGRDLIALINVRGYSMSTLSSPLNVPRHQMAASAVFSSLMVSSSYEVKSFKVITLALGFLAKSPGSRRVSTRTEVMDG